MVKLLKYLKSKERNEILFCLIFIVIQVWLELKLPDYMSQITTLVQTPGSEMSEVINAGVYMVLCALGSLISAISVGFFAARLAASFSQILRSELFDKVSSFSMGEINQFSTSSLITRSTNDVTQIQMFVTMALQLAVKAPLMAIWAVTKIAGKGIEWSIATGVTVAILMVLVSLIIALVIPRFRKMQTLTDNLTRITRENLTGLRVVRAYNAEDYQKNKFDGANDALTDNNLFTNRAMSIMMPVINISMSGLSLAIYWIGASLINVAQLNERLTLFSNMVVFSSYASQVIMSFIMMVMIFIMYPRANVSARRINEVLNTKPSLTYGDKEEGLDNLRGVVTFKDVSFKYPDAEEYVLKDINFTVNEGETIAFIGSTGSGKSTLINLVPRFFDASEGEVLVDGINVKDYKKESLLNKIGYVPQRAVLFKGTVGSNISFGDNGSGEDYNENDVKKAVEIAQSKDFVEKMAGKYDALIAQGGTNVSGGQKQRLSIARAIYRKPEIYIFDDSFSALDYKTDRVLRNKLKKETSNVTSMIVAQRIGTIIDADQIVVLDEGKIVGRGKHKELLKTCEVYREIAMSQLSEEELA
ncbi:ABC transporter ATP-binding protein [Anaerosphaera multitolerans]|uniref:ABC transporter ATP-binding protein n=1 Tax=Anaerosphaera multitolerans TaxID=2487351 RepID=A0A437S7E3_9FIRM|nr:ABC transporter ATP-binding protein [Anaerosphaera multitolerans]RVU54980.1 ABC transporter ATP-binding protein [Anaerosphaera multitolerans]